MSGDFPDTAWTLVAAATREGSPPDAAAMEQLCRDYYAPVLVFIRSRCQGKEEAEDLAQDFMAKFAQGDLLQGVDASKGRLRWFLLQCVRNFLSNAWRTKRAQKRGGGLPDLDLDAVGEIGDDGQDSPDREFDRAWAQAILARAMDALAARYESRGKGVAFPHLKEGLGWTASTATRAELAEKAGMTPGGFRTAVSRLRDRYRERIEAEIRQTVGKSDDVVAEMAYLRHLF